MGRYSIVRGRTAEDDTVYYGIALQGLPDILMRDVSHSENETAGLMRLLNDNDILPVHFDDVFMDYFAK